MEKLKMLWSWSFLFSLILRTSTSLDNITVFQSLSDGETLISHEGIFELGFFSPGNSKGRYVGIWYHNMSPLTVVWVANRETALNDTSGVLKVTHQGLVLLVNGTSNSTVWSSTMSIKAENPVAQLLVSGNLVVKDGHNEENFLWQSFDFLGDTFLPGSKIGWDPVTGIERTLTSSKSADDPGHGDFKFRIDPRGYPQAVLTNGTVIMVRVGPWNGLMFSGATIYLRYSKLLPTDYDFIDKELICKLQPLHAYSVIRSVVTPWGGVQLLHWSRQTSSWETFLSLPEGECDKYAHCGANSVCRVTPAPICTCLEGFVPKYSRKWKDMYWSDGCVRITPLSCSKDGFKKHSGVVLPDTSTSWHNMTMNLQECEALCRKNCSCTAYSNLDVRGGGSGCILWFHDLIDMRQGGQDLYIRLPMSELGDESNKKKLVGMIVGSILFFMSMMFGLVLCLWRKKLEEPEIFWWKQRAHEREKDDMDLPMFDLSTIVYATNYFSSDNKLGEGGFGSVYKGALENGTEIAVKRLSIDSEQGLDEFKNEVQLIAKLQHRNLVKLLGCCIQRKEKLLIYELVPNRSLDTFIFDDSRRKLLDWAKRFQIIGGTARGLVYLHQDSRLRVIHRDLKTSNILLDKDMNAKISDFGLARTFAGDQTEARTKRVMGTYGYISPEYAVRGSFSMKSDVFAFGVIVLEIVSGKKNREFCVPHQSLNLLGHAWELWNEERPLELVDESVRNSVIEVEALRCIHIGLLCVQGRPEDRPNMSSVVRMLEDDKPLPKPRLPAFYSHQEESMGRDDGVSANERFQIIGGTARGLVYLHHDSRLRVIHRDLKASNILLDKDMNAKISDFGLARTFAGDQSEATTKRVMGTYGYISPEYAVHGSFSTKSDVFAFGVIVLEIVSGKKNREFCVPHQRLYLLGHAWELWNEERPLELVDESVRDSVIEVEALRCIQIGLLCVQGRPEDRPNMSSVVRMLEDDKPLPEPRLPAFTRTMKNLWEEMMKFQQMRLPFHR